MICSYIINLDRSIERYNRILPYVVNLGFDLQRISAIDGKTLSQQEIEHNFDLKSYHAYIARNPKLGVIGCYLSHLKAWHNFLNSEYEFAIIFEDDVYFAPAELKNIIQILVQKKEYWDIVNLGSDQGRFSLPIENVVENHKLVLYLSKVRNAGGYIINKKAAKALIGKALPIKMPLDYYFTRSWELGIKFTGINPKIIFHNCGESDIRASEYIDNNIGHKIGFSKKMLKKIFQIQSSISRISYNLKIYFYLKNK